MYFAVLWRHPKLSLAEFALVSTSSLRRQGEYLFFETDREESALLAQLEKLWGIVKWGKVVEMWGETLNPSLSDFLAWVSIIGVNDQKIGMEIKKLYGVRRFKIVETTASDLEIKKDGKELIWLGWGKIGLVYGWQDIAHFERIDFWKPASGMEVGMMPAKLAQVLVNIGRTCVQTTDTPVTVYDPFCGFGTTGFVANRVGANFVWSDLVITGARENAKRWQTSGDGWSTLFTVFKHDVTTPFVHPVFQHVSVVVTEGWLGPVVSRKTREPELLVHAQKIQELYMTFLSHISRAIPLVPIVLTIPSYARLPDAILPVLVTHAVGLWYEIDDLGIYSRKGQEVCRQIVVLRRK